METMLFSEAFNLVTLLKAVSVVGLMFYFGFFKFFLIYVVSVSFLNINLNNDLDFIIFTIAIIILLYVIEIFLIPLIKEKYETHPRLTIFFLVLFSIFLIGAKIIFLIPIS